MTRTESITECILVELSAADVGACLQLSVAAGWNQTAEDWWMMLSAGRGFGYRAGERLVATAVFVPYNSSHGWIAMMLVDDEFRRRGLATELTRRCVETAEAVGVTALLDATPAGREVYRRLGFVDGVHVSRLRLEGRESSIGPTADEQESDVNTAAIVGLADGESILGVEAGMFDAIERLDADVMGSSRVMILRDIVRRATNRCFVLLDARENMLGFCLGRPGRVASQIGPVVLREAEGGTGHAVRLIAHTIEQSGEPLIIDVPDVHRALQRELEDRGFRKQRSLIRMALPWQGGGPVFPDATRLFAIGGPAIG